MPLYTWRPASPGITPVKDQNAATPANATEDPLQKPDFIREYEVELIAVRRELGELWADYYGKRYGKKSSEIPYDYDNKNLTVSAMERDMEYEARRMKLEQREAELIHAINAYKYVASLGDAPAVEDVPGEGDDVSGATARVGSR